MTFSVVPVWIVEDDKGNQYGVCYSNEEANRIRSALVKAAELQSSEQPQSPDPQSSEGESTESSDDLSFQNPMTGNPIYSGVEITSSNGTAHPEQQD